MKLAEILKGLLVGFIVSSCVGSFVGSMIIVSMHLGLLDFPDPQCTLRKTFFLLTAAGNVMLCIAAAVFVIRKIKSRRDIAALR